MLKKVKNLPTSCCCALYWLVFFELTNTRLLTHIARAKAKHYYHYGKCSKYMNLLYLIYLQIDKLITIIPVNEFFV